MSAEKCPACGKVCHTKDSAKRHAIHLKRSMVTNASIQVYKCPDWKLHPHATFHVGHRPSKRGKGWKPRPM
jgi:hypothetical protein